MSDFFPNTSIDLGIIKVGQSTTIEYSYDNIVLITRLQTPCECTTVVNRPLEKKLIATYIPAPVPQHLKQLGQNWYQSAKVIKVTYNPVGGVQGLEQNLVFTAKIIA